MTVVPALIFCPMLTAIVKASSLEISNSVRLTEFDHADFLPAWSVRRAAGRKRSAGRWPGNLPDDHPPMRRRFFLQPDPRVFVANRAFGIQGVEKLAG